MTDEPTLANILAGDDPYGYGNPDQRNNDATNMLSWPLPPKDAGWMRRPPAEDASWLRQKLMPGPMPPMLADFLTQMLQYGPMAIPASRVGAGMGRDAVMAHRLENKARMSDGVYDHGITGAMPHADRSGANYYYDPVARSSTGMQFERGMRPASIPEQMLVFPENAGLPRPARAPEGANFNRPFEVIPGGKKD